VCSTVTYVCAVREILPELIGQLLVLVVSSEAEQQEVRCGLVIATRSC
jgi:hypothetical protein